tara:strand:+ start:174 stop:395 length:222 start_codon:yes stop_codon:yes gene_type:complete
MQFDGGSRGNPGPGGSGAVIYQVTDSGEMLELWNGYWYLGTVTNNQAEYSGLIEGLKQGVSMKLDQLKIEGDR